MNNLEFGDYGLGGPLMGEAVVGFDLANPLLGGPEQGGSYTGGMGGGDSRTAAERLQAILDVSPYVAPSAGMNLDPITSRGQTGYYFANEQGLPARYGDVGSPKPADPATYDPNAKYIEPMPGFVPVDPNAMYRLVNGGTDGKVVYSGAGGEGLRNVFQQANQLTMNDPKNAYWGVEVLNPATGKYDRVAENQGPNGLGIVGKIAGVALPIAAAIATGGASLGVQIAAGAAAGGLGGFLSGNDILKSALIGGATAGVGNVSGFNEAVGGVFSNAGDAVKNALIPEVAKQAAASAGGDIVVTGLGSLAKGAASGLLQGAASGLTNNLSDITGYQTPAEKFVQQPPPAVEPTPVVAQPPLDNTIVVSAKPAVSGSGSPFGASFPIPVDAMLSGVLAAAQPAAAQPTPTPQPETVQPVTEEPGTIVTGMESYNPTELLAALGGAGALATAAATAGGGAGASSNIVNGVDQASGDIVVSGSVPGAAPIPAVIAGLGGIPAITQGALSPAQTAGTPPGKGGVLGTGLSISQLLSLGSIGGGLLQDLLAGGGGDTGAGVPYVSPFGTGAGFAPRQDMRANPNIIDYERYGFGPEAMFFQPQYSGLLPANAPAPQAPPAMTINPALMPIF